MKVTLTCRRCGASRQVFPSQLGLRYKYPTGQYQCRPCWNEARKGKRFNPRVKQTFLLECGDCGKRALVNRKRFEAAGKPYRCRPCYLKFRIAHRQPKRPCSAKRRPHACIDCGKARWLTAQSIKTTSGRCLSCKNKGHRSPTWRGGKVMLTCCVCGKTKEASKSRARASIRKKNGKYYCRGCAKKNKPSGPDNAAWRGGKSFEPYPTEWTPGLRRAIRERDGHRCFVCGGQNPKGRKLPVHHVDYDKANLEPSNLVALCTSCHAKTNFRREQWRERLEAEIAKRLSHAEVQDKGG